MSSGLRWFAVSPDGVADGAERAPAGGERLLAGIATLVGIRRDDRAAARHPARAPGVRLRFGDRRRPDGRGPLSDRRGRDPVGMGQRQMRRSPRPRHARSHSRRSHGRRALPSRPRRGRACANARPAQPQMPIKPILRSRDADPVLPVPSGRMRDRLAAPATVFGRTNRRMGHHARSGLTGPRRLGLTRHRTANFTAPPR